MWQQIKNGNLLFRETGNQSIFDTSDFHTPSRVSIPVYENEDDQVPLWVYWVFSLVAVGAGLLLALLVASVFALLDVLFAL